MLYSSGVLNICQGVTVAYHVVLGIQYGNDQKFHCVTSQLGVHIRCSPAWVCTWHSDFDVLFYNVTVSSL